MHFYTNFCMRGSDVLIRGYQDGKKFKEKIHISPYLFVNTNKETKYRTIHGSAVERIDFEDVKTARKFLHQYQNVEGFNIYGMENFVYPFINDMFPGMVDYDPSLISIANIDIETDSEGGYGDVTTALKEITAITMKHNNIFHVFGCKPYNTDKNNVVYYFCENEENMLLKFLDIWRIIAPDVVTGWNIEIYDIPYIVKRMEVVFGENFAEKMSPWGILQTKKIAYKGNEIEVPFPLGVTVLDYMALYKKFSYTNQESYALDHISYVVLKENKLDYSEHKTLHGLYKNDYNKFIEYNIHDVELVSRLEDKLGFIMQVFAIAFDAKVNFADAFTSVKMWDVIIHNYLIERNIVVPLNKNGENTAEEELVGGFVKDPIIGMHDWVVSFDLNSLYPHLIMQYNISPEMFIGKIQNFPSIAKLISDKNNAVSEYDHCSIAANGCAYLKEKQGFLAALMEKVYNDRSLYKNKMIEAKKQYEIDKSEETSKLISRFHNLQLAKKIQLNSAYGSLGNKYFRWFDHNHAEAITKSGQLSIRWIEKCINTYMNKIFKTKKDFAIAIDTDSIYIDMNDAVKLMYGDRQVDKQKIVDALDKFANEKLTPYINNAYVALSKRMNAFDQKMFMKRENIADKAIWTAKKKYIMNVYDEEGVRYNEPKLKIMGLEAIKSSTPSVCRSAIKEAMYIIMNKNEDELISFVSDFKKKYTSFSFEDIAFPRGCKGLDKYTDVNGNYIKGTPIHVRGAIVYNTMLKKKGLENDYEMIYNGSKIKFCYLKLPNPTKENIISVPVELPKEFDIHQYIDFETQFQKSFIDPLTIILDTIKWKYEEVNTLESLFA